jgi:hypothetical protein
MIENNQKKSKGGARAGAGRKRGSLSKRTREIAEAAASQGITPLEVMMRTMMELYKEAANYSHHHDHGVNTTEHDHVSVITEHRIKLLNMAAAIARHAAPYMHPRLSAIEHTGKDGAPLQSGVLVVPGAMSLDEWEQAAQAKH